MLADRTSLADLGLLPDPAGAWPLATWLDSTHSRQGHDALKRLIATPLGDTDSIRVRQALLPRLVSVARQVPWAELQALAAQVERFLTSNYEIVPAALAPRTLFAARFGDVVSHVAQQLQAVDRLLALSDRVYGLIDGLEGDRAYAAVVASFAAALQHSHRDTLFIAVQRGHDFSLAGLDALVRETRADVASTSVTAMQETLASLVVAIGQLDAFCSLAIASHTMHGAIPRIAPRGASLSLGGVRHPLLPTGARNDVQLADSERVLFLTGPNMAGKSTLLRAIGIAVYCAHLGMAVSATAAIVPLYDQLLVSITVRDSLQKRESLYLAEIRRVRTIVEAVDRGDAVLAIFDEVFRGTNIKDATQATTLLVDGLARSTHGSFVIASHLAEVGESRVGHAGVACWCMDVETNANEPRFTYRVRRGVSDVHLGMVLLDAEGVGPMLRRMAAG